MDIDALAKTAASIIFELPYDLQNAHGFEVAPGFFTLHNDETGQCKAVLYHPESGLVFKRDITRIPATLSSRRHLGEVTFEGVTYSVRLPENHHVEVNGQTIVAQEYIIGEACHCFNPWCDHTRALQETTKCNDTHRGNWKFVDNEIVLFDFEGIRL